MTKALGLAFALTLALTLPSAAEETTRSTVQTVDRADQSIVLDDGTQLWVVSGAPLNEVTPGDQVRATYEMKGDKKVIVDLEREAPQTD